MAIRIVTIEEPQTEIPAGDSHEPLTSLNDVEPIAGVQMGPVPRRHWHKGGPKLFISRGVLEKLRTILGLKSQGLSEANSFEEPSRDHRCFE